MKHGRLQIHVATQFKGTTKWDHHNLKIFNTLQSVQIRHESDPVFQCLQELHLEFHHLAEVSKQIIQLQTHTLTFT